LGAYIELTYIINFRRIGTHVVDFLLVLIELVLLGVTAEALRAKIVDALEGGRSVSAKFSRGNGRPHQSISHGR